MSRRFILNTLTIVAIGLCGIGAAAADEALAFRDPGSMTVEERMSLMRQMEDYRSCAYREAMARVDKFDDIRRAADEGLGACRDTLDALRSMLTTYRFDPEFSEGFVRHAQSRAVRMLLPELALHKAAH